MVKVSIAMATYNGQRFIREQLDSIADQSMLPDELIITDDCSTDDTIAIVEQFSKTVTFPVKILKNEKNIGYTQNFANAMLLCTGDVVFLSDQDDVWFSSKISRIVDIFEKNKNCILVVHDAKIVDENLAWNGSKKMEQIRSGFGSNAIPYTGALSAVGRKFLTLALPVPQKIEGHDVWLHKLCDAFEGRRVVLNECLQNIRRHESNTSEWVVNSLNKIYRLDVFLSQLRTQPATNYNDRVAFNTALNTRLRELAEGSQISTCDRVMVTSYLGKLDREKRALDTRQLLVNSRPLIRRAQAFKMLFSGDYRHFNGWRSFMRDFIR